MDNTVLSVEVHDEVLDVNEPYKYDESISELEFFDYTPLTQANNNTPSHQIRIDINAHDIYTVPSKSGYPSFSGR